jgi:hypothetical protein
MKIETKKTLLIYTLLFLVVAFLFSSCTKEEFEPRVEVEEVEDTTDWQDTYGNGGTLPGGGTSTQSNPLVGTKWVLTKMVSSFATEYPNDTITFESNTEYTIEGSAVRAYQLNSLPSSTNYDLSLYYFMPFGGSHYSGQVGYYFVDDGEINNIEFIDTQNSSSTIRAWFVKI